MCGIAGSLNIDLPLDLSTIAHRGPDFQSLYEDAALKLGHVRLSIQDLSERGNQPFRSADGQYIIVFNGEIYNHWDIRNELLARGHEFISSSDTETILTGYIEYGTDVITMLNGIFAFCIYDKKAQRIIVARDRFGVKPLYYFHSGEAFAFASELKALLEIYPNPVKINKAAIADYVRFLWSPGEETPVKEIKKLLQGRYIEISLHAPQAPKVVRFHSSCFDGRYSKRSEPELINELDNLLQQAVKRQQLADVPIGFFLSGGLDSSLLVAIAKKINADKKVQCFTIETPLEHSSNTEDLHYAKKVASHLGVALEIVKADVDILKDFDKTIFHLDEPLADPAAIHVLNISRRARQMGFKVLIGGTAGDDLFSGYRRHQVLRYENLLKFVPRLVKRQLAQWAEALNVSHPKQRRIKKWLGTLAYEDSERMFSLFEWLSYENTLSLFQGQDFKRLDAFKYFRELLGEIPLEKNRLNQLLHLEMNTFLVDHNLNYTDKMGMAVGVEIRVPYLDNDLVDFSCRLPPHLKMRGKETKYILKKVAERYLPSDIIYRDKTGFGAPVRKWITEDLQDLIDQRLSDQNIKAGGIFNPGKVRELIENNKAQSIDASYSIWALLAIESWLTQFVQPDGRKRQIVEDKQRREYRLGGV